MAMIALAAASIAIDVGAFIYRMLNRPHVQTAGPVIDQVSTSANGSPIPFGYGTVRIAGQIIWSTGITFDQRSQSAKGGPSITYYDYFSSFACAMGEGPMCIRRIWADTKLIFVEPGTTLSEFPVEDFPAWSSATLYNPGNIVSFQNQVYEALTVGTNLQPSTHPTNWQLISDYPAWSASVNYSTGDVVKYAGTLWAAQAPSLGQVPGNGATTQVNGVDVPYWTTLNHAYPQPTIYPGDESQLPDPTIQAVEGVGFTPAYRGIGYFVYHHFPLLKWGNRLPNLRAEVTYLKVRNVL